MPQEKVDLNTLKKGTKFRQFDTDTYNYVVLGNYPTYLRYRVEGDCGRVYSHPKNWPTIMVTVIK